MRYYLPTSTSNFNNILSTESVSPRVFYPTRKFGYSNYQSVLPNATDDFVLLYSKYPVFELANKDEEAYPLVIEIESDALPQTAVYESDEVCVYCSDKTIYLNPFNTRFIFRSEAEMISAINNSKRSIETKMTRLYSSAFSVISSDLESFSWNNNILSEVAQRASGISINARNQIKTDFRLDRLKGLLYGLIIGANRSRENKQYSDLLVLTNDLNNALSTFINVRENRNAEKQYRECETLLNSINNRLIELKKPDILSAIDDHFRPCAKVIVDKLGTEYPEDENRRNDEDLVIDEICKQYDSDGYYKYLWDSEASHYCQRTFAGKTVLDVQRYINELKSTIDSYFPGQRIAPSKLPVIVDMRIMSAPSENDLLSQLLNELLDREDLAELIANSRYEFAVVGGTMFKTLMHDNWDGEYRDYINGLLRNLNENAPFDITRTKSPVLSSFAALCKKGEKGELESFYEYLIANGIGDIKIAFTLWGTIFGFACMPKTVTKELFDDNDVSYISAVYKHAYEQLLGEALAGDLSIVELPKLPDSIVQEPFIKLDDISENLQRVDRIPKKTMPSDQTSTSGYTRAQLSHMSLDKLKGIAKELGIKGYSRFRKDDRDTLIEMILEGNPQQDLFHAPQDFEEEYSHTIANCGGQFFCDPDAFERVKELVRQEVQKELKEQIRYIQEAVNAGGYRRKDGTEYRYPDKSNRTAIDSLSRNVASQIKYGRSKLFQGELDDVLKRLKELYPFCQY